MEEHKGNDFINKKRKGDSTFDIYDFKRTPNKKSENKKNNSLYDEEEY